METIDGCESVLNTGKIEPVSLLEILNSMLPAIKFKMEHSERTYHFMTLWYTMMETKFLWIYTQNQLIQKDMTLLVPTILKTAENIPSA